MGAVRTDLALRRSFVDAARPLILLDIFGWPAAYQKYRGADYVAPNLDTSVWFHQFSGDSDWLLVDHESPSPVTACSV